MSELKDRGAHRKDASDAEKHLARLEEQQRDTLADKERTATLATRLNVRGTREGARSTTSGVEKAGSELDQLADAQKRSHDRAARREKKSEGALGEQAAASRSDDRSARAVARELRDEAARRQIEQAAKSAQEDVGLLEDLKKKRQTVRSRSEKATKQRIAKIKAAKVEIKTKQGGA